MNDSVLVGLLQDMYGYVNDNIDACRPLESSSWDSVALKNWFESDRIQNMMSELFGMGVLVDVG